jgi:probable F420-dependent oxidoreductase
MYQDWLGRIGVWSLELRFGDRAEAADAAAELDHLGYGALWIPGGVGGDITGGLDHLLDATQRLTVATGVLNIWKHEPSEIASWWKGLTDPRRQRVLLGLGVSHVHVVGQPFKPVASMRDYLEQLAALEVSPDAVCLAALGPKMLELARDATAGAHPYLVTPEHTAQAREILGVGKLVAPQQGVVLHADRAHGRDIARGALRHYSSYPNYRNNWQRLGFSDEEIDNLSDRLVDALYACGPLDVIRERIDQHFAAGADHVCLQAVSGAGLDVAAARPLWRELAAALIV